MDIKIHVIKNLWTSSFVLVAGGWSLILLGAFHQIVDVWGFTKWTTVFMWVGANAVTLYVLNNFMSFERLATRVVGGEVGQFLDRAVAQGAGSLLSHTLGVTIAITIAGFLYRRKIFLRV
jgi:predicted acyltransferase